MNPQLRKSAERLFEWARKHSADTGISIKTRAAIADTYHVSQALLAEHPEDDDEPVTKEWLRSVGFKVGVNELWEVLDDGEFALSFNIDGRWQVYQDGEYFWLTNIKSRRDVRRYCTAFGVRLTSATDSVARPELG